MIAQTTAFKVAIKARKGEEYTTILSFWPTLASLKSILETESLGLKREAHRYNPEDPHAVRLWTRIEELRTLENLFLMDLAEPQNAPYTIDVKIVGVSIGSISATPIPMWSRAPPR